MKVLHGISDADKQQIVNAGTQNSYHVGHKWVWEQTKVTKYVLKWKLELWRQIELQNL